MPLAVDDSEEGSVEVGVDHPVLRRRSRAKSSIRLDYTRPAMVLVATVGGSLVVLKQLKTIQRVGWDNRILLLGVWAVLVEVVRASPVQPS